MSKCREELECPTTGVIFGHWLNVTANAYRVAITSTRFPRDMLAQAVFTMSWEIHTLNEAVAEFNSSMC